MLRSLSEGHKPNCTPAIRLEGHRGNLDGETSQNFPSTQLPTVVLDGSVGLLGPHPVAGAVRVDPLSAHEVAHDAAGSPDDARGRSGRLAAVRKPTLFETSYVAGQMRLLGLAETLGEDGWLEGSQAGELRTQKLTPAGDASAGSLHLHGRHVAATQRRILHHRYDSHTSRGL